jgi:hypothetical protein
VSAPATLADHLGQVGRHPGGEVVQVIRGQIGQCRPDGADIPGDLRVQGLAG